MNADIYICVAVTSLHFSIKSVTYFQIVFKVGLVRVQWLSVITRHKANRYLTISVPKDNAVLNLS